MHAYTLKPIIAAHGIDYWQYLGLMSLDIMWIECVVERFHFFLFNIENVWPLRFKFKFKVKFLHSKVFLLSSYALDVTIDIALLY